MLKDSMNNKLSLGKFYETKNRKVTTITPLEHGTIVRTIIVPWLGVQCTFGLVKLKLFILNINVINIGCEWGCSQRRIQNSVKLLKLSFLRNQLTVFRWRKLHLRRLTGYRVHFRSNLSDSNFTKEHPNESCGENQDL